jgi:hypothetical protein
MLKMQLKKTGPNLKGRPGGADLIRRAFSILDWLGLLREMPKATLETDG